MEWGGRDFEGVAVIGANQVKDLTQGVSGWGEGRNNIVGTKFS